jgi:hypothetical protein
LAAISSIVVSVCFLHFAGNHSESHPHSFTCLLVNYYNFALQFEQSFLWFGSFHVDTVGTSISIAADQLLDFFQLKDF